MTAYKRYETSNTTDFLNTTIAAKQKNTRYVLAEGAVIKQQTAEVL